MLIWIHHSHIWKYYSIQSINAQAFGHKLTGILLLLFVANHGMITKTRTGGIIMAQKPAKPSFKQLESKLSMVIGAHLILFGLYLLFAAYAITWLKVILALAGMALSVVGVGFLVLIGEHKRRRSLWLLCAFGSIGVCILMSLLTGVPGPY